MKMKEACRETALTERAIRLYLSKNMLSPEQKNGILHFSADDIQTLKNISVLRRHDFTLEQIVTMLRDPLTIPDIIFYRIDQAASETEHEQAVYTALCNLKGMNFKSAGEFAVQLNKQRILPPEPNFAQFDEIDEETRQNETNEASKALERGEKKARRVRILLTSGGILMALIVAVSIFLSRTRIDGFIPVGPFTVLEKQADNLITISIERPEVIEIIGKDIFAVPCNVFGSELVAGDTYPTAQLVITLTNYDLMKLGINPLQDYHTRSEEVNTAWLKTIIHALFKTSSTNNTMLWVREIANKPPLVYFSKEAN